MVNIEIDDVIVFIGHNGLRFEKYTYDYTARNNLIFTRKFCSNNVF